MKKVEGHAPKNCRPFFAISCSLPRCCYPELNFCHSTALAGVAKTTGRENFPLLHHFSCLTTPADTRSRHWPSSHCRQTLPAKFCQRGASPNGPKYATDYIFRLIKSISHGSYAPSNWLRPILKIFYDNIPAYRDNNLSCLRVIPRRSRIVSIILLTDTPCCSCNATLSLISSDSRR